MYRSKFKKLRNEIRILRKSTSHKYLNNNVLVNYYYSYLKYIRLDKIIADYKLRADIIGRTNSLLSLDSLRGVMELAPYNSKPPIREPNMPEQRGKKDDKKEKKKKKPVIRVDEKINQDLETDDTVWRLENDHYRYKWGIKLSDDSPAEITLEDVPQYVTKRRWGVNVPQFLPETKDILLTKEESEKPESLEKIADPSSQTKEPEVLEGESNILSLKSVKETAKNENKDVVNKIQDESLKSSSCGEDTGEDYNIPKELPVDGEIIAWKEVVERSKPPIDEEAETETVTNELDKIFIRPEPPEPKLDVQAVKSIDHVSKEEVEQKNEEKEENMKQKGIQALDHKKWTLLKPKSDVYISKKKIHFDSHSRVPPRRSDTVSLTSEKALTKKINKIVGSSNFENTNPIIKKFNDIKRYLLQAFFNKDTLAEADISAPEESSEKLEKVSNRIEALTPMTKPLLTSNAQTLTKINSENMSYNDVELDKKPHVISDREMENTIPSTDDIEDNKNILPTKNLVSEQPCSNKKTKGVDWIPLLCTNNLENNLFRKGSSETSHPKTILSSIDDYADAVGGHIVKEDIRVPNDPHQLTENPRKTAENQYNDVFDSDENFRNYDRYFSYPTKEEKTVSGGGEIEAGNLRKFYDWSIKMAMERERLAEEMKRDKKNTKMARIGEIYKKTEKVENSEDSEPIRWQLTGNTDNSINTVAMETTVLNAKSNPEMNLEISRTAPGHQNQIVVRT